MTEVLSTSLTTIAADSLSKAERFLEKQDDEYRWIWTAVAVDHSLYAFCIACLYENCPDFVLDKTENEQ